MTGIATAKPTATPTAGVKAFEGGERRKSVVVSGGDNIKSMLETLDSEKTARQLAEAEWKLDQRAAASLELTLALGRADFYPEQELGV